MESKAAICIIGGYDDLSKAFFKALKEKYKSTVFVNLLITKFYDKNLYNYIN